MSSLFNNISESIKSIWKLSDSPITTIEKRLAIIRMTMGIFGWDTQRENWRPGLMCVVTTVLVLTSLFLDIRKASIMIENRSENKIEDIVEMFVFIVTQSVCSYRIYLVVHHKVKQRNIIKKLMLDFCEWMTTDKRREIMSRTSRHGWFIFKVDIMILSMTTLFFVTRSLIGHTFPTPASGLVIPYVDNNLSPYYEIRCTLQIWILSAQIGMALAINNMFCALAVMICGHLECLTVDIDELDDSRSGEEMEEVFDNVIKKHVRIYEVVKEMNGLYGTVLGLQPLYTGAIIITSTLLYDGSQKSNVFLQITFDHIVELFIYCYIGDLVSVKSFALSERLYTCNWITMQENQKKTILQMMHRCQKPFTLDAGIFGPLTMEMYSKSMQMTYSMWTVFKGRAAH